MPSAFDALVELLDLERIEQNLFRGRQPNEKRQRVFGGHVAGQALIAAGRTVEDRSVHSLHAYFLRPGDPQVPIVYQVERTRDGRSFATRRVTAIQHGRPIFALSASFHIEEESFEHQRAMPDVPGPDQVEDWQVAMRRVIAARPPADHKHLDWVERDRPIESRHVELMDYFGGRQEARSNIWIRAKGRLPDDPLLHRQRQPDTVAEDHRRRPSAAGDADLPGDVIGFTPAQRNVDGQGSAVAARPPKLRPI